MERRKGCKPEKAEWRHEGQDSADFFAMSEIPFGGDAVADELLELLDVGKTALLLRDQTGSSLTRISKRPPMPGSNATSPISAGNVVRQLLGHPGGAEHPAALVAEEDFDAGLLEHISVSRGAAEANGQGPSPWGKFGLVVSSPGRAKANNQGLAPSLLHTS